MTRNKMLRLECIDVRRLDASLLDGSLLIATLGPRFTSSDIAAKHFIDRVNDDYDLHGDVQRHPSFDDAARSAVEGAASGFVVPNAYDGVNRYYMDWRYALAAVFVFPTPPYGLAGMPNVKPPEHSRIAVHPACLPLLKEMVPQSQDYEKVIAPSTSAAAAMVLSKEADLALTNVEVVGALGLRFISHTRPITMVWSLFVCSTPVCDQRVGTTRVPQKEAEAAPAQVI